MILLFINLTPQNIFHKIHFLEHVSYNSLINSLLPSFQIPQRLLSYSENVDCSGKLTYSDKNLSLLLDSLEINPTKTNKINKIIKPKTKKYHLIPFLLSEIHELTQTTIWHTHLCLYRRDRFLHHNRYHYLN